jgi:hypothetical protein
VNSHVAAGGAREIAPTASTAAEIVYCPNSRGHAIHVDAGGIGSLNRD